MALIDEAAPQSTGSTALTRATGRTGAAFAGIVAGNFLVLLDATILNVALPDLKAHLHASAAALPWTVDAYTVVFAGLMLASGAFADRFGARRVYRGVPCSGSAVAAVRAGAERRRPDRGPRAARRRGGRPGPGLAGAARRALPRPHGTGAGGGRVGGGQRDRAGCGPVLGGALVAAGGWQLVFLVNPPIALVTWFAARGFPRRRQEPARPFDAPAWSLSIVGLGALTYGLVEARHLRLGRAGALVALAAAALACVAVALVERRAEIPVLPPELLRLGRVRANMVDRGRRDLHLLRAAVRGDPVDGGDAAPEPGDDRRRLPADDGAAVLPAVLHQPAGAPVRRAPDGRGGDGRRRRGRRAPVHRRRAHVAGRGDRRAGADGDRAPR